MRLATVQKRNAFTLVELLVVIAIIVILMALTVGVISKVYVYLDEVKVNTEVNRMAQACEQFKSNVWTVSTEPDYSV
jgi:prepilin-type N-terminal cleavage/methylation domain-containing protein